MLRGLSVSSMAGQDVDLELTTGALGYRDSGVFQISSLFV